MTIETVTVDQEFVTVDLILWRRFRSEAAGRVERTFDLNRGLAAFVFLPVGTVVTIEIPDAGPPSPRPVVSLWS